MTLRLGAPARRWALYFLAEYSSIFVIASVAVTLFWGGWLRPLSNVAWLEIPLNYGVPLGIMGVSGALCFRMARRLKSKVYQLLLIAVGLGLIPLGLVFLAPVINHAVIGLFWFLLKVWVVIYAMIRFRGTWPRFRYDQLMNIGRKRLIPIGMAMVLVNGPLGKGG
jgi:NADH-quinone oxidoreductase subunit H